MASVLSPTLESIARKNELLRAAWGILRKCDRSMIVWDEYINIGTETFNGPELADAIAAHLGLAKTDHPDTVDL